MIQLAALLFIHFLISATAEGKTEGQIFLIDKAPPSSSSDYVIQQELTETKIAAEFALKRVQKKYPTCQLKLASDVGRGSDDDLVTGIRKQLDKKQNTAFVGFGRTNLARVAAFTLKDHSSIGISIGAAAINLREVNPRFFSIAAHWENQWLKVLGTLKENNCQSVTGIFNPTYFLSKQFLDKFSEQNTGKVLSISPGKQLAEIENTDCVFFGTTFSDSIEALQSVSKNPKVKLIIGTGDWIFAKSEILRLKLNTQAKVQAVSGWANDWSRIAALRSKFEKSGLRDPGPIGPYTNDSIVLAARFLCTGSLPDAPFEDNIKDLLSREYEGCERTGNLRSKIHLTTLIPQQRQK